MISKTFLFLTFYFSFIVFRILIAPCLYLLACKYSDVFPESLKRGLRETLAWPEYGTQCRKSYTLCTITGELAALLSFGILCPAYAVVCVVSIIADVVVNRLIAVRYVRYYVSDEMLSQFEKVPSAIKLQLDLFDSSAVDSHSSLKHCMWPAFTLSAMFMSMFLWDMASDEISFERSLGIPIITLLTPLALWLSVSYSKVYDQSLQAIGQRSSFVASLCSVDSRRSSADLGTMSSLDSVSVRRQEGMVDNPLNSTTHPVPKVVPEFLERL